MILTPPLIPISLGYVLTEGQITSVPRAMGSDKRPYISPVHAAFYADEIQNHADYVLLYNAMQVDENKPMWKDKPNFNNHDIMQCAAKYKALDMLRQL